ncbi:hypothetical protein yaldo0001_25020 [Yersinia aldovae ATCC 35236]|nr:hypothetical protein yaldo0001_25020 [Yersinia aldovae ATCC 35236]
MGINKHAIKLHTDALLRKMPLHWGFNHVESSFLQAQK